MPRRLFRFLFAALLCATLPTAAAAATSLTWYGHSAFKIVTPTGKVLLIDPWITNPANKHGKQDLAAIDKADLILISHGHFDHVGDAVGIAKKTGAKLVSTFDLGNALTQYAGFPKDQAGMATEGNFGGEISLLGGEVKVAFIPAVHGSTVAGMDKIPHAGGNPGGFLIMVKNGPTIYHTGDTDVFGDMRLIPQFHKVDVMLACIGDHFTMGPQRAAEAVRLVHPKVVIPMHYGTFPVLTGTPQAFGQALKGSGTKLQVMQVDQTLRF